MTNCCQDKIHSEDQLEDEFPKTGIIGTIVLVIQWINHMKFGNHLNSTANTLYWLQGLVEHKQIITGILINVKYQEVTYNLIHRKKTWQKQIVKNILIIF